MQKNMYEREKKRERETMQLPKYIVNINLVAFDVAFARKSKSSDAQLTFDVNICNLFWWAAC